MSTNQENLAKTASCIMIAKKILLVGYTIVPKALTDQEISTQFKESSFLSNAMKEISTD